VNRPRMLASPLRQLASATVAAVLVAGILPAPVPAVATAPRDEAPEAVPVQAIDAGGEAGPGEPPSTAYLEWLEHEHDRIEFTPGGRVTVGFKPRRADAWPVGGQAPRALPAGRAAGRDMARMGNGSAWAALPGTRGTAPGKTTDPPASTVVPKIDRPVDAPSNDHPIAATAVTAATPEPDPTFDLAAASGLRRQVFGFLPYWEVSGASTKLNYDVLSTIAYFSVGATERGNLKKRDADGTRTTGWGGWTSSSMTSVINAAHRKGTRVVLTVSVFAWTSSQARVQRALLGSSSARLNLAMQVVAAVRDRGADGVNLDFEPLSRGYGDEFVSLLRTLRSEFNKIRSGYQVTYDTTAYIGNYPLEASVGRRAADAIFVMGYDYRIGSSSTAGSIDPLSGPTYDLADTVRAYKARVPGSRIILGVPWYGRAWSTATSSPRSRTISGLKYGYSTPVNYENVLAFAAKYGRRWDPVEQSPYVVYRRRHCTSSYGCVTSWRQIWYDDAASLRRRYQLVNDYGLRGAGMWALGYDGGHSELYRALATSFLVDKSAPTAGVRAFTAVQGDEGFIVRWAGKDVSRIVSYDVQVSVNGGRWKAWRTGTRATSDVFLGRQATGYAFRVRAKDSKGHLGAWNVTSTWDATPRLRGGFGRVTRDGLSYRTGPSTGAARLGSLKAGTIVALTRGPIYRDGYTWYEATQPIREWSTVSFAERGVWIAVAKGSTRFVVAVTAPNATIVKAGIRQLDFGASGSPSAVGTGAAAVAARAFSPNRDGSEDALRLRWTNGVRMGSLKVNVLRKDGSLVGSRAVSALAAGARGWTWDGRVRGVRVKDGTYLLQLVGTAVGRTYRAPSARPATTQQLAAYGVRIDTVPPRITSASATNQVISPNGDRVHDTTTLKLAASGGAVRWTARVTNAAGTAVRTKTGSGASVSFTWNGTSDAGRRVPDGRYLAALTLFDAAGNPVRRAGTLIVDTKAPVVRPATSAPAFSPNGDGALDTTVLSFTANEPATGTARLYRGTTLVRTWKIAGKTAWKATWNGTRGDGSRVRDGVYTLKVRVTDAGGNTRTASKRVVVDRTLKGLAWSSDFFSQDRDALKPASVLSFALARDAKATLRLYDAAGRLVRTVWRAKSLADGARSWKWTGGTGDGTQVPQGRYLARLRVTSPWATVEYGRWVWASAFSVVPNRTTVHAGQTLRVRFRSTEKLSSAPRVTFSQPGRTGVTVTATKLSDGWWKASFSVRSGSAGAGSIKVTAKDSEGGVNTTRVPIRVTS
jgi:spore germination protein YaaH/flagellar hook assembly protein FlgD